MGTTKKPGLLEKMEDAVGIVTSDDKRQPPKWAIASTGADTMEP